jgi:hypothetical protein
MQLELRVGGTPPWERVAALARSAEEAGVAAGVSRGGSGAVDVDGRRGDGDELAAAGDECRCGVRPQPHGDRLRCVGDGREHPRPLPARPRQSGQGAHRAALQRRVRPAGPAAARLRGGSEGVLPGVRGPGASQPSGTLLPVVAAD